MIQKRPFLINNPGVAAFTERSAPATFSVRREESITKSMTPAKSFVATGWASSTETCQTGIAMRRMVSCLPFSGLDIDIAHPELAFQVWTTRLSEMLIV